MVAGGSGGGWKDMRNGAVLQVAEAASLGLPFEVWKTRMGRYREESTVQALRGVYNRGGGLRAFWAGFTPKMLESASKGAVFMYSKEAILALCNSVNMPTTIAAFVGGAGAGICQVSVMAPMMLLVTGAVTGDKSVSTMQRASRIWSAHGLRGFYPGGTPIAFRQATNWASREGFTVAVRQFLRRTLHHGDMNARLSAPEEVLAAAIGGTLSCWNHPFEVARIEMQSRADLGQSRITMMQCFAQVYKERGIAGLFRGVPPRILLSVWQTLFMVTGGRIIKERLS